jgi:hypothetical protein
MQFSSAIGSRDQSSNVSEENEAMLQGFRVPDLAKRSDITAHFPVMLFKADDRADGAKRFYVTLDARRFRDMKDDEDNEDAQEDYAYYTLWRLVYALRRRSDLYTIERPLAMAYAFTLVMHAAPAEDAMPLSTHDFMEKKKMEEPRPALPSEYNGNELNNESSVNVKYTRKNRRRAHHSAAHNSRRNHASAHNSRRHHASSSSSSSSAPKLTGRDAVAMEIREINRKYPIQWTADEHRQLFILDLFVKKIKESKKQTLVEAREGALAMLAELTKEGKLRAFDPKGTDIKYKKNGEIDENRLAIVSMIP